MSSAATHLQRMGKVERRVLRLLSDNLQPYLQCMTPLDILEHYGVVAALVVLHKSQVNGLQHLARLRL